MATTKHDRWLVLRGILAAWTASIAFIWAGRALVGRTGVLQGWSPRSRWSPMRWRGPCVDRRDRARFQDRLDFASGQC
ncbi:MAG: hypothetical protein ACK5MQ_14620 [Pikeienuella sp.]